MTALATADVVVIGTGIAGVMAALHLQNEGRAVTLLERGEIARGASSGNAGILAYPEIIPIAAPGIMRKAPKWLLDPLGPLSVPPSYAVQIAPWLFRFWRASQSAAFERGLEAQIAMMALAAKAMASVTAEPELGRFISMTGTLDLYDTKASFDAAADDWHRKQKAGFQFETVGRAEIEYLQPGLAARFAQGVFTPGGLQVSDPYQFTRAIAERVRHRGGSIVTGEALAIDPMQHGARVRLSGGGSIEATTVVIACGAWSKRLASGLGDTVPLDTERGYNTTLLPGAFPLQRQLYFNDHGFVVTPLSTGIRVGGAVELGGLKRPPNFRRAEAMLDKAAGFLPGLKTAGGTQWMGFRPSLPDGLPVVGRSTASASVLYAFGHGHLGLTQSAATGRLIADLAAGRSPALSLEPFRPGRFR